MASTELRRLMSELAAARESLAKAAWRVQVVHDEIARIEGVLSALANTEQRKER